MLLNCGAPWISGRSKPSTLKKINPNYSFEGLMLKFPILWLLDANSQLIGKDPVAEKD